MFSSPGLSKDVRIIRRWVLLVWKYSGGEKKSSEFEVQLSYSCHCFCLALCNCLLLKLFGHAYVES